MNDHVNISFFASAEEACGYLEGQQSVNAFANPHVDMDMATYSVLIRYGFRRSGNYVYRPHCPQCNECVPVRIPVKEYSFSRNDKRCRRRNADLEIRRMPARFKEDQFELYARYINSRHGDGSMSNPSKQDYMRFLISAWADTEFIEYRLGSRILAVSVCDVMQDSLSAVYTFFDPQQDKRSLGHMAILDQIDQVQKRDMDYLYLGYWIANCDKMAYKSRYQPLQVFRQEHWHQFSDWYPGYNASSTNQRTTSA